MLPATGLATWASIRPVPQELIMKLNDLAQIDAAPEPQAISTDVLLEKYAKGSESSVEDIHHRVSTALAAVEPQAERAHWQAQFLAAMNRGFIPAGRILSAAGTGIQATLINCFVQPVGDSVSDDIAGKPSIYKALAQAAETMRRGGGVGYDFSRIRPRGALVKGTHSNASGPVSYMRVFDRSCETVESAGARRGAQMGILRCDHPDLAEFIHAKDGNGLANFNISIGVTDGFMQAVEDDAEFELVHPAQPGSALIEQGAHQRMSDGLWVYRTVRARALMDDIVHATYDHADPGVVFLDRMNQENNLWYAEVIEATNPCSEQSLPDYGCCCLGSIDLTRFVRQAFESDAGFDWAGFKDVVRVAVRMLDNVLDVTWWPLPEQRSEAMAKRRIGLGFLGLGSALVMLGIRYDSAEGCAFGAKVAETMRDEAYMASIELAPRKGAFPALDAEKYLKSGFAMRLPDHIRDDVRIVGIRNSHLLSIAPTGTIALAFADNASNGIEPAYAWSYTRKKRMPDGSTRQYTVEDHAWRLFRERGGNSGGESEHLPEAFVSALDMTAEQHLQMLVAVQPFIDSAISKTVNVPADYPYEAFRSLYMQAWKAGLKGLATYRPNPVTGAVLSVDTPAAVVAAPDDDPLSRQFASRPAGELEGLTSKVEFWTAEGKKSVYLTVNFMRVAGTVGGEPVVIERPVEFFVPAGQRGNDDGGQQWISSNMRLLSMVARSGASISKALANMCEVVWDKGPVRCGFVTRDDGAQVPRFHDSEVAAIGWSLQQILARRGFLDSLGNQVPVAALARRLAARDRAPTEATVPQGAPEATSPTGVANPSLANMSSGKKCPDCGAHALHKVDGCLRCANCHYIGNCG
jgi:ribonucleoside-diphosphate reductase alpha chain